MACPNCGDEMVRVGNCGWYLCIPLRSTTQILFCPFCGEELKTPSQVCSRGQDD